MATTRARAAAWTCAAVLAAGCGELADGDYRGQPLAVLRGTLDASAISADKVSFALAWSPAADHDAALGHLGAAVPAAPDSSYTESCSVVVPQADPVCDGTAARGTRRCEWADGRVTSLLRVVEVREHVTGQFEIPLRDLPPEAARYDLSRQGGIGSFALARVVVFDDRNRDGEFGLGTPEGPPEPTLADSGHQGYRPGPGQPRRSYLVAYLNGLVAPGRIDPALAEVLLFLPQGFSLWVEEEWLDDLWRTTETRRSWLPIDVPIGLVAPAQDVAGCVRGVRETVYVPEIPGAPAWCSEDRFRATWSGTTAKGCVTTVTKYAGDFTCAALLPPAWPCPSPTNGSLLVSVETMGQDRDPDGYTVRVDGGARQDVAANASAAFPAMSPGNHVVTIDGLAANCAAAGPTSMPVQVVAGETVRVAFAVECLPLGALRVFLVPAGSSLDFRGFAVSVDGGAPTAIALGGWEIFTALAPGIHRVALSWDGAYCVVNGADRLDVAVPSGATVDATFSATCGRSGDILVSTSTTGFDLDADGYVATATYCSCNLWDCSSSCSVQQPIPASGSAVLQRLPVGAAEVRLGGLARNCTVLGPTSRPVSVVFGRAASVAFAVECVATGGISVTTTTAGADPDPDGYTVAWSGAGQGETVALPVSGTVALTGLVPGEYLLTLGGMARNCTVTGPNPRSLAVVAGRTPGVTFAVQCLPFASLAVTAATTGVDLDPDGFGLTWSGGGQSGTAALPANGTTVVTGLVAGAYQLAVGGVAPNCDGTRTSTATVAWGATASVAVDITCAPDRALAFHSPDGDIFFIHSNGTGLQRLTVDPANDSEPAWSPDGTRIAFTSERDGNREIYVMGADGSAQTRLTNEAAADHSPAWSRDGARIAFVSERDGRAEIYVMNADGSGPARLTNDPSPSEYPAWSPDGARIAFARGGRIWVMGTDGTGANPITSPVAGLGQAHTKPAWSPDGTKIAFAYSGSYAAVIAVSNVDGTGESWLLWDDSGCSWPDDPDWSPDGRRLAFAITLYDCMGGGLLDTRIQTIRADGTDIVDIASGDQPAWRP